jgi:hypothetical protein
LEGRNNIGEETIRFIISFVERQPATGRRDLVIHTLTSVVFPYRAGAKTRISRDCKFSSSLPVRCERATNLDRRGGMYSFAANSGAAMY